jgi:hypothetical protein
MIANKDSQTELDEIFNICNVIDYNQHLRQQNTINLSNRRDYLFMQAQCNAKQRGKVNSYNSDIRNISREIH